MTEKSYNPKQKEKKAMKKSEVAVKMKKDIIKDIEGKNKVSEKIAEKEEKIAEDVIKKEESSEKKVSEKPEPKKTKPKIKKNQAVVNSSSLPISTKKATAICKFIKGKTIEASQAYLEEVIRGKKAIPMKGEIPHRKGKMMSGRFPKETAKHFITLLKSLIGNSNVNEINNPIIVEAIANMASRPYARFGKWKRKRTHVKLVASEKKINKKKKRGKK